MAGTSARDGSLQPLTGRAKAIAVNTREALERLYRHDERVSPWSGTGRGVVQAVNTFDHHEGTVRGTSRPERNLLRTVTGEVTRTDRQAVEQLQMALVA